MVVNVVVVESFLVEGLPFVAEAEWNEEFREECDVDSVKFMMSEVLSSLVDPSLVEDPINVVFLVLVEPLLVEKDAEVREKWEVDSVV